MSAAMRQKLLKICLQNNTDGTGIGYLKMEALAVHIFHVASFLPFNYILLCFPFRTATCHFNQTALSIVANPEIGPNSDNHILLSGR